MKIRSYHPEDLCGVISLFSDRNLLLDTDLFSWKKKAPFSFSWVGEEDGKIVAHYSIIELPLMSAYRVGFAVDAIFSKSHGQMQFICSMLEYALNKVRVAGLHVIVGFANKKMAPIKKFLGWKVIGHYNWAQSKGKEPIRTTQWKNVVYERNVTDSGSPQYMDEYLHWRWGSCPRTYGHLIVGMETKALFSKRGSGVLPMMVACREIDWDYINEQYQFNYLLKETVDSKHENKNKGKRGQIIEPLYYDLNGENEWDWPERWPLETVEGVTLGW